VSQLSLQQTIQRLEEVAFRAWPALEEERYDGWILRFANGYSRRANSVNPLYPGREDVGAKIERCERLYRDKNLKPVFRLTPLIYPANLEELLAGRGYESLSSTSVQLMDLSSYEPQVTEMVEQGPEVSADWLACLAQASGSPVSQAHQQILAQIQPRRCFAVLRQQNRPVACGLGVLEEQHLGLFDIVTAPAERRKGFGRKLVNSILGWAKANGGQQAYLQVVAGNEPALKLYSQLGFKELYRYWYRVKDV
jgi:GNAT superfamily N-acetyltransferase